MKLDNLRSRVESEHLEEGDLVQRLEEIEGLVRQAGKRARSLSHFLAADELSPADLAAALSERVRTHREFANVDCELQIPNEAKLSATLGSQPAGHRFRLAQEAVRNAVTPGDPNRISVQVAVTTPPLGSVTANEDVESEMRKERCVVLRVRADGTGIHESIAEELKKKDASPLVRSSEDVDLEEEGEEDGIGFQLMKHRADLVGAELRVASGTERGTLIECVIPVSERKPTGRVLSDDAVGVSAGTAARMSRTAFSRSNRVVDFQEMRS